MAQIEIEVQVNGGPPKAIKVAEDATIDELFKTAGIEPVEPGEEVSIRVGDKDIACRGHHRLHEHGIRHGHHLHCHPREVVIIVNTREKKWDKREISYDEVVKLAFGNDPSHQQIAYTVDYTHGPEHHRKGSLAKGQSVKVKSGMIFDVTPTNRS